MALLSYQQDFISFLIASGALTFGEFTLKSGRKAPYFINTGNFNDGEKISRLGAFYASHLAQNRLTEARTIFGPAYKGIPLAVATSAALFREHKLNIGFTFNRKEAKDHGDKGTMVGMQIQPGDPVVIVEDVITAGTTLSEVVPMLRDLTKALILGVVIACDRCERGSNTTSGKMSAVQEVKDSLKVPVFPLITVHDIITYLSAPNASGMKLSPDIRQKILSYLEQYGAT